MKAARILGLASGQSVHLPFRTHISKVNYSVIQKKAKNLATKILSILRKGVGLPWWRSG